MRRSEGRGYPTVEFKQTIMQRIAPVLGGLIGTGVVELLAAARGVSSAAPPAFFLAGLTIGSVVAAPFGGRFGVVLTPWTAEVNGLRRRVIWWPDVQMIRVERRTLMRTVVIYEYSGRRTRLRVPITGFLAWDGRFEEKYHAIGRWWLDHRLVQPGVTGPEDAPPSGFPINDAVSSTPDVVADDVPARSSSGLRDGA